jgi:tRNA nucleotidyltransferase (CCA-adding enzyme)
MQVILTHENADFDAIASLLAAHKLYPGAQPVLPHRVNRNVKAFLHLYGTAFPLVDPDTLARGQHVQRVILVDTQKLTFVRGMGKEINQVLVIDHHTPPDSIPVGWRFQSEPLGAATTLLVEAISTRLIPIAPAEATLMLTGIYEDTGSLTYASTTPRDLRAAAWLIDQGADLETTAEFLDHPLSAVQQQIYRDLKEHVETQEIDGHPIVLSWAGSPPDTEEEISTLAHKLRNFLDPSALFILVGIGDNTQLVARSATDDINVSEVAEHLGGGGHDRAAAALIHDRTPTEVLDALRAKLPGYVQPRTKVRDLMSYGVRTVRPNDPIKRAATKMLQTGHEGFPVVDEAHHVVGLVTRNAVDRAQQHGLDEEPVRRIMQPGTVSVAPEDAIERVRALMIQTGWGQIPVTMNGKVAGVVTRTDLIRLSPSAPTTERQKIANLMEQAIPAPLLALIHEIGAQAADSEYVIYFVGGIVRDLLLGQDIADVDLVVEGDAIDLGRALVERFGGEIRSHSRFGTVKWLLPDDIWSTVHDGDGASAPAPAPAPGRRGGITSLPDFIDLVTARTEFYEHPTALPMVSRSSIKQDLHRRDFTINTLAIRLDPQRWGELLDFYGGQADLEAGVIRVLHSLSFVDDPTRILRAARFEARLGFQIDKRSEALIAEALSLLDRVTGERIRHEFDLIFQEAKPEAALDRLEAFGALAQIHGALTCDAWLKGRFRQVREAFDFALWEMDAGVDERYLYWALFLHRLDAKAFDQVHRRMKLSRRLVDAHESRARTAEALQHVATLLREQETVNPSEVVAHLEPFNLDDLALAWLVTDAPTLRQILERFAGDWRDVAPALDGEDLKAMGFDPGPIFREILGALKRARLDGKVDSREEERALVRERFGSPSGIDDSR